MPTRTQQFELLMEHFQALKRKLGAKSVVRSDTELRRITPSQWGVLHIIGTKGPVSTKEIARQLGISSSAATQLVDGLVENGHLLRKDNPADRRSYSIGFSDKTKAQMRTLRKKRLQNLSEVFSVLSDEELAQYLQLSGKVAGHVTSHTHAS